ncbi:VWA domain-containing protein [Phragmitibacter flavus]|uniref:VWA domain-containing protein n=1 Tax=Phragmitibacter flavus TaxID=2576071 RepID=A0A5R8K851_9BACT|nr:VIT and VWA domain-containing protein [Phragmitibacter flavus]TLD68524.1 VWA domain-containing protein [Phragmitibacter flavus]
MQTTSSLLTTILLCLTASTLFANSIPQPHPLGENHPDHSLPPQFEIIGNNPNLDALPLKSTKVKATISGIIASVTVEQTYTNTGTTPIEAIYRFPASTRAAVHGVDMQIGPRLIKAKIQEKQQAKATFEKAKAENKTASLLEQHRPNVFQMSVANILPGDEVRVFLHYSEKLNATERVYEFHYPTVVGPRYTSPTSSGKSATETWTQNPHLAEGQNSPSTFQLDLTLNAGLPVQSVVSPTHQPHIIFSDKTHASLTLPASTDHANRDFVLHYQLAQQQVASGLLLHQGNGSPEDHENFFLLNVQPPARIESSHLSPRDYLFIIDVSGSMHGFPIDTAKTLLRDLINGMQPTDHFNVVLFAGSNKALSQTPLPANQENLKHALNLLDNIRAFGSTELLPALKLAFDLPRTEGRSRNLVLITDGFVSIEKEAFQLVSENLGQTNFFAFGIGSSVNRWLIEGLAHAGQGEPFIVLNPNDAPATAKRFHDYIKAPVLTDIEVTYEGFATHQIQPTCIPDLFAERPLQIIGKWKDQPQGRITVRGKNGNAPYQASFDVAAEASKALTNPALRPLWAHDRIRELSIASQLNNPGETQQEITTLGLTYHLLTEHTSFVGVDETPREILAQLNTVTQPLPLPQGVSNHALPAGSPAVAISTTTATSTGKSCSVPEPGVVSLLILAAASLALHRQRRLSKSDHQ